MRIATASAIRHEQDLTIRHLCRRPSGDQPCVLSRISATVFGRLHDYVAGGKTVQMQIRVAPLDGAGYEDLERLLIGVAVADGAATPNGRSSNHVMEVRALHTEDFAAE